MATSKFGSAFAAARKSGAKTFEFGGKSYTTQTKEEAAPKRAAPAKAAPRSDANYGNEGRRQAAPAKKANQTVGELNSKIADGFKSRFGTAAMRAKK